MLRVADGLMYPSSCTSDVVLRAAWCRRTIGYRLESNGKFYKVLHVRGANIQQAKALCKADGGRLASAPYGPAENMAMESFRAQLSGTGYLLFVDGTDAATENNWVLPTGNMRTSFAWYTHRFTFERLVTQYLPNFTFTNTQFFVKIFTT
jgi:hypothetical protein